jgi:DNA-directed RNA polymerase specialized sigma24 family protein
MKKDWQLTADALDQLLKWLDPDRDRAGQRYEQIRRTLIVIFTVRGCPIAEELADETINRVIGRIPELAPTYIGDPAHYFRAVAHNLHSEYRAGLKKQAIAIAQAPPAPVVIAPAEPQDEQEFECLEHCLQKLKPEHRELVLKYYQENKQAKIDHRKLLADRLGIALNALRIRAHRIRNELQKCLDDCVAQQTY